MFRRPTDAQYAASPTGCPGCGEAVIVRDGYTLVHRRIDDAGHCERCRARLAGVFDGPVGHWGSRRRPVIVGG